MSANGPLAEAIIEGKGLRRVFGVKGTETVALHGADIEVHRSEMVAITGPSGSGKSTLMAILGCLDRPTAGVYRIGGQDVTGLDDDELSAIRNRTIGFVFQQFNLLTRSTALQNVELPQIYAGAPRAERRKKAAHLLEMVGLGHRIEHRPTMLSGGEMQRVAIARALANDPLLILADEPTGNLDSRTGAEVMALFRALQKDKGVTLVIVTHDPKVAAQCDRVVSLFDGRVVRDGKPEEP